MNQKMIGAIIGIAVVVGGGSFYGGMQYGKSKTSAAAGRSSNLSPEERQARLGQVGAQGQRGGMNEFAQGGGAGGEIIAKDDKSITVKLRDGGSKIIFLSNSTSLLKTAEGSLQDLAIGEQVTAIGTANQDGSMSAQSVQIRSAQKTNP